MTAAVTSAIIMRWRVETSFGVAPTDDWHSARVTGETLTPAPEYTESEEIRPDGQIAAVVRTDAEGSGPVNGELPYGEWDEWFAASLLCDAGGADPQGWSDEGAPLVLTGIDAAAGTVPAFITGSGFTAGLKTGQWIKLAGFVANPGNNTIAKVVAVPNDNTAYLTGAEFVTETVASAATVLSEITNGITQRTFTVERELTDDPATEEYHNYPGAGVDGFVMEMPTTGFITTTWNLMSKIPTSQPNSSAASDLARTITEPMTAANIVKFFEGDPELGDIATNSLAWDPNPFKCLSGTINHSPSLRTRKAWGTVGPALDHGRGDHQVNGTFRLYYNTASGQGRDDYALMDKVLKNIISAAAVWLLDSQGNFYVVEISRLKFTNGSRNAPAKSQDIILELEFQGYLNPDDTNINPGIDGVTIRIVRGDLTP